MSVKEVKAEEVKPYEENAEKKGQVSTMFNNIAKYYDFLNHFLSLGIDKSWRKKAIATLQEDAPKNILDVATGTGDLAIEAKRQLNPDKITGIDISVKMLEVGNKKIQKLGIDDVITLQEGDSENLPFEDNTFDAAIVAFGVRNFANVEAGLRDMVRVLQPNSKLVVLEFSKPTMFPFKQLFNMYFKYILPFIGKITSKDKKAYGYLYESVQAFPEGQDFLDLLTNIGLKNATCKKLSLGICSIYTATK
ncbi:MULTISPECIES: bifunctional demethylmenaquinone methyltransferase/2-methoxy-6-polyprenyl-1,4-benzoquinol methylase UbiE [unclassified Aureispira]|uniref:bifunctional demethylmenaquinone methyltransferase/2-methoxy-6-polyprenyl-1,4-benzoquinol methylase UbiE n=1 Tax=unclassified Aureispira TaxID=2649989 RepID=UPI000695FE9A|nr:MULTISPECIES: bifunctional demethylmenaquinone methyltransferase/2-methoxy-6-polyprenyl-1,4-benzoquinol methylase UbiE [unclassified Aureispira]WMX12983.1 bifunctional demethylmenaquinone methyltransferase/2-methoxy-6-polyprenyl-1,4-benzoquinol methylase UbiE [Aureispira sp. CCB-E]